MWSRALTRWKPCKEYAWKFWKKAVFLRYNCPFEMIGFIPYQFSHQFFIMKWEGCTYVSVGQGSCRDDTMQSTPYCQVAPNELASYPIPSLDECQDLCDSYQACVAVVYDSSFGCRIHFYSYSDAADAGDDLGLTGFGCIQGGATGDITQTNGSGAWECLVKDSCGSDGKSGSIFKNLKYMRS